MIWLCIVYKVVVTLVYHLSSQSQKGTLAKYKLGGWKSTYSMTTALCVVLREECVFKRYAPTFV